ncbi:MAG: hypothetical protein KDK33_16015 [Leptospiraceae bacterium]|nr:hypothetical protein [Leptospiraceae bacterium]
MNRHLIIALFTLTLLPSCGASPVDTGKALAKAACESNADDYLKHFDLDRFAERYLEKGYGATFQNLSDTKRNDAIHKFASELEAAIRKSAVPEDGTPADCDAKIELVREGDKEARITYETPLAKPMTMILEKIDGQWKIVGYEKSR